MENLPATPPTQLLELGGGVAGLTGCEGARLLYARVVKYFIPSSLYTNAEFVKAQETRKGVFKAVVG